MLTIMHTPNIIIFIEKTLLVAFSMLGTCKISNSLPFVSLGKLHW